MISQIHRITSSQLYHAIVRMTKFIVSLTILTLLLIINGFIIYRLYKPLRYCTPQSWLYYIVLTLMNMITIFIYLSMIVRTLCLNKQEYKEESIWAKVFRKKDEEKFLTLVSSTERSLCFRGVSCFYSILTAFCCCFSPQTKHGLIYAMPKKSYATETDTDDEDDSMIKRPEETDRLYTSDEDNYNTKSYDLNTLTRSSSTATLLSPRTPAKPLLRRFEFRTDSITTQRANIIKCVLGQTLKAIILIICMLISSAVILSGAFIVYIDYIAAAKISGRIKLDSKFKLAADSVNILRDNSGMVNIQAKSLHDALFAQGFAHAQDRLFQLEITRRVAKGTLSELFGSETVTIDEFSRLLGFTRIAEKSIGNLSPSYKSELQAYTDGINAYLASDKYSNLGLEMIALGLYVKHDVTKWTLLDTFTISVLTSWQFTSNFDQEISRFRMLIEDRLPFSEIEQITPNYPATNPTVLSFSEAINLKQGVFNWTEGIKIESDIVKEMQRDIHASRRMKKLSGSPWRFSMPEIVWSKHLPWYRNCFNNFVTFAYRGYSAKYNEQINQYIGVYQYGPSSTSSITRLLGTGVVGSNSWVVSGKLTKSGKPILASDIQHHRVTAPNYWYYNHLQVIDQAVEQLNVAGISIPGIPHVLIGRNPHVAWSISKSMVDTVDTFVLKHSDEGTHYLVNNTWKPFEVTEETIRIKNTHLEVLTVRVSEYGPVIDPVTQMYMDGEKSLAVKWSLDYDKYNGFQTFSEISTAHNVETFTSTVRSTCGDAFNFVYADTSNNIAYLTGGNRIPIRKNGMTGRFPLPGTGEYDWLGFINPLDLPLSTNPIEGYIISSNNQIIPEGINYLYGPLSYDWDPGFRASRVRELLQKDTVVFTVSDVIEMQKDQISHTFLYGYKNVLKLMQAQKNLNNETRYWISELLNWDGNMTLSTSKEPTVFALWVTKARDEILLGPSYFAFRPSISELYVQQRLLDDPALAIDLFQSAVLSSGSVKPWNSVQMSKIDHISLSYWKGTTCICNRNGFVGGEEHTIRGYSSVHFVPHHSGSSLESHYGHSYSQVLDLSSICGGQSQFTMPMGSSGRVFSQTYDVWNDAWYHGHYMPVSLCISTKNYKHILTLKAR